MNKSAVCCLFGAGEYFIGSRQPKASDFIIAVDGGFAWLKEHGITSNLIVGDFDSLAQLPGDTDTVRLPKEKDDTDMVAALREGWERGYRFFHIYGGTGGRLDHTLANIQLLADVAARGGRGFLHDRDTIISAIKNSCVKFPATANGTLSVFSHTDVSTGVFEHGLKYPLTDATLYNTCPIGISNEFSGFPGSVSVQSGTLIIIYPKNIEEEIL